MQVSQQIALSMAGTKKLNTSLGLNTNGRPYTYFKATKKPVFKPINNKMKADNILQRYLLFILPVLDSVILK